MTQLNNRGNYNPWEIIGKTEGLQRVIDSLIDGTWHKDRNLFQELYNSLVYGCDGNRPDEYYVIKDFEGYRQAQNKVDKAYRDRLGWAKKSFINIANSGKFTSDRTISQYANEIWTINKVEVE